MSSCSGDGRGGSVSTPQAENQKRQSIGTRSRVARRERRSRVEKIYVAFAACVVQHLRPQSRLLLDDDVGARERSTCMARCGLRAAFVWLCKPQTIKDYVLYHATVVRRCTRYCTYPRQQSFAMCCGRRRAPDGGTQNFKSTFKHRQSWMTVSHRLWPQWQHTDATSRE